MDPVATTVARREVSTRGAGWAMRVARALAGWGIRPNSISGASVVFAVLAGLALGLSPAGGPWAKPALLVSAALCIQLRLLCNLFDGMVAVECGMRTKSGEIFNDLPDRLSDSAILIGAGYAARQINFGLELGWIAALLAMLTAYVRVLGASAGVQQFFLGPMAKQHRMALITVAALAATVFSSHGTAIFAGTLAAIVVGCVVTVLRRLSAVLRQLTGPPPEK